MFFRPTCEAPLDLPCQLRPPAPRLPVPLSSAPLPLSWPGTPFLDFSVPQLVVIPRGSAHCQGLRGSRVDLCVLGLSVSFGHTPAAATAHAHARRFGVSRLAMARAPSPAQSPARRRGCPGMSPLPKGSAGTARVRKSPWQLRGLCAISCNQRWDPATRWASWRFVPCDGRLGGVGAPTLQPSSLLLPPHPQGWQGCQADS